MITELEVADLKLIASREKFTWRFNREEFNEFISLLSPESKSYFSHMFLAFCDIYGKENIVFGVRRRSEYFSLGIGYGYETCAIIRLAPPSGSSKYVKHIENDKQDSEYILGHSFKSILFKEAANSEGYPLIKQERYSEDESFEDIIRILQKYKKKIQFYAKKYNLNREQTQHFALWVEIFNRSYTNARVSQKETIWKSYPKFYQYIATLIKLDFDPSEKRDFIRNSIPIDLLVPLESAPREWLEEILGIHLGL